MIVSIQYLRGLAALMVVMQHVARKSGQFGGDLFSFFHVGGAGVDIFFIISGFIMCHTTEAHARGGAADFLKRRAVRILPLYWLLSLAVLPLAFLAPGLLNAGSGGPTLLLESFLLLPGDGVYLIANGWTLSYEFFFYFLFAAGLAWGGKHSRAVAAGLIVALVSVRPWAQPESAAARFATDSILIEFVFGMGLYALHRSPARAPRSLAFLSVAAGIGLLAVANYVALTGFRPVDYGIPALLLAAGLVSLEPELRRRPIAAFESLGDSSYSLYLVHPFALTACTLVFRKLGLLERGFDRLYIGALASGSIAAGWLCYTGVELPLTRKVRQWVFRESRTPRNREAGKLATAGPR